MPPMERESSRDGERNLRHQYSASSDHGRALVPMWDSSDPERAPPPLPLNPQSPSVGTSRAGTSLAIQSAHAALTEKARESGLVSNALAKRMTEVSPDRNMMKGSSHRRMQSLQPGTVRDLSLMIEGARESNSPTPRSPEKAIRPGTPSKNRDPFMESRSDDRSEKAVVLSPVPGPSLTPILRPQVRRPHQSILGENTPPQSATMLALQNMSTPTSSSQREPAAAPLSNVTNESTALTKAPQSLDVLSNQILSLTSIATALQKEMSQLSRRSRDNATDLLSLKEATNARDEDIRKSLRELISNVHETRSTTTRDPFGGSLLLENKTHGSSPLSKAARPFSLPRIPSPNSFAASLDRESMSTPSLYASEAPATIALLEKILREMGTKAGQEMLVGRLSEIVEKLTGLATAEKVEELLRFVKANQDQAVIPARGGGGGGREPPSRPRNFSFDEHASPGHLQLDFERSRPVTQQVERLLQDKDRRSSTPPSRAADVINEDILKIIRTVKDSVAQGGGLTAEVKALVRELRGEVLGMGREIGRRLDEVRASDEGKDESATKEEMAKVIEEGLTEMKQHMNHLLREHRRQSAASASSKATSIDYQEIYNAVRAALKDTQANKPRPTELSREDVMQAVKEAWEAYKPEIEIQQLGLERDEVLACLEEGLRQHAPKDERPAGATQEEVFKAVVEGLKHFVPPQVETPVSLSRDEILGAVRECLEEFEFPVAPSAIGAEITKEDMVDAVAQGLNNFDFPRPKSPPLPQVENNDEEIIARLHEIKELMREEFKAVSDEAKQNVAANGRDTEQVLDATKDGFEKLRTEIESYVNKVSAAASHDELMESMIRTLDVFRDEIAGLVAKASDGSKEMLRTEIETLRDTVNSSLVPHQPPTINNREVLEALHDGVGALRNEIHNRSVTGTTEILDALQEGISDLRESIDRLSNKPTDLTANDEILDALKSGLDEVRSDIDGLRDQNSRALTTIDNSAAVVPVDEVLKHDDIKNLELLITQVRAKVEAIETIAPPPPPAAPSSPSVAPAEPTDEPTDESVEEPTPRVEAAPVSAPADPISIEKLAAMEEMLRSLQESLGKFTNREPAATDAACREDVQAIETILRNTKARLDDLIDGEQAVRKEHIDILETHILEAKDSLNNLKSQVDGLSSREDINMVETLVAQMANGFDAMKERHDKQLEDPQRITKTDVDAIEAVCLDVKAAVEQMIKADIAALPSKEDLANLETLVKNFQERIESQDEVNAKAIEDRHVEISGVGDRVAEVKTSLDEFNGVLSDRVGEVKTFLEELNGTVKGRLEEGVVGIETVGRVLGTLGEILGNNANVGADLKALFDSIKTEFEDTRAGVAGAKLEVDEKFQQTTETLQAKIDERINEVVSKYDEFMLALEERTKAGEARDIEMEAAVVNTKAIADDLKSLIDTLGSTVTDSLEKMEEASKTVFERVEELVNKSDAKDADDKAEHQLTRDEVKLAVGAIEGVQGHVTEYQPKILETIKDVLDIVGQHYEHSKSSILTIQEKIEEAKPPEQPLLPPIEKYDDTDVREKLDRLVEKADDLSLHEKLDKLVEKSEDTSVHEKLDTLVERSDDTLVHEKLDKLVDHTEEAGKAFAQLDTLEKVHEQVLRTAAEITEFIAAQRQKITEDDEDREKTLQETTLALERRLAEKEQAEAEIVALKEEGSRLKEQMEAELVSLREEKDRLKEHMEADFASLKGEKDKLREQTEAEIASIKEEKERMKDLIEADVLTLREEKDRLKEHMEADMLAFREEKERLREHVEANITTLKEEEIRLREHMEGSIASLREEEQQLKGHIEASIAFLKEEQERARESVELGMASLKEEEARVRDSILALKVEQENLARQKTRLAADVSSLETALRLRREELHEMEARAEGLERRILEGVMDHSRILLMSKGNKGRDVMSRKRVPSQKSGSAAVAGAAKSDSKPRTAFNMAMSSSRNLNPSSAAGSASRRILSLSQISQNASSGGVKRSQSVRTPAGAGASRRKSSWGMRGSTKGYGDLDMEKDKENAQPLEEEPEAELGRESEEPEDFHTPVPEDEPAAADHEGEGEGGIDGTDNRSEAGTLRRSSLDTTVITGAAEAETDADPEDEEYTESEWTESAVPSSVGAE